MQVWKRQFPGSFVLLGVGFIGVAPSGLDYTCKSQQKGDARNLERDIKGGQWINSFPFWLLTDNLERPVVTAVPEGEHSPLSWGLSSVTLNLELEEARHTSKWLGGGLA